MEDILEKQRSERDIINCSQTLIMWQILVCFSSCSLLVLCYEQQMVMLNIILCYYYCINIIYDYQFNIQLMKAIIDPVHAPPHQPQSVTILEVNHSKSMYIQLLIWHTKIMPSDSGLLSPVHTPTQSWRTITIWTQSALFAKHGPAVNNCRGMVGFHWTCPRFNWSPARPEKSCLAVFKNSHSKGC